MKLIVLIATVTMAFLSFAQSPTANFSATPLNICIGDPVNFTDLSVVGASAITNWNWDFGDGNSSTNTNPSHVYDAIGSYTVTLVVTAANGQADAEVKVAYITVNDLPNAGFTVSGNGCTVPFDVTFTNTSEMGGNIAYDWDFGNSQTSQATNPTAVTYNAAGTYSVSLNVTNTTTGCSNSFSQDIVVSDYSAGMSGPSSGCVGEAIPFTDASTVGTNVWTWNDGNGGGSNLQNPSFTYSTPGTYTITLNAGNATSGCSDLITQDITINPLPTPSFSVDPTTGCAPLGVTFSNTSGAGTNFDWDFGNGSTFNGPNPPIQNYVADGSYSVSLTMTDANGCTATESLANIITVSAPTVNFSMDNYNGCAPLTVQFSESSTSPDPSGDPITTWLWDFGDGSGPFSGQIPPPHDYPVGVYTVSLTVLTQNGCQASLTLPDIIEVGSIDQVNFSVNPMVDCAKNPFDFIDLTTFNGTPDPGEVIYAWDFGDSGMSSVQSPTYEYPLDTGYFDVELIVDWRGCVDTFTMTQAVYVQAPISIFTPDQMLFCNPSSFPVTLNVDDMAILGVDSDSVEMIWKWGDGATTLLGDSDLNGLNQGTASHDYGAYGSFVLEQVVYNHTTGCEDSTQQTIHISETIADFTVSNDSVCVGVPLDLTSTSTSSHTLVSYSFDMGNGGFASGTPTVFTYNNSGTFDITLTATNNVGCSGTNTFVGMTSLALPTAIIDPSAIAGCSPVVVNYTDLSLPNGNGMPISSVLWTFPDASTVTTGAGASTSFNYLTDGVFTTTMIATDEFGCNSLLATVNMVTTKPVASFVVDSVVCDLEQFTATNQSTGATSSNWFIDSSPAGVTLDLTTYFDEVTSLSAEHVDHNIVLIVTDPNGCTDTTDHDIIVSMPRADIDFALSGASTNANGEFTCPPVFSDFTDFSESYGTITNWSWDFGNGNSSTGKM
ncbi:MAG: PKD domain-containing protein [Crocinitomicaceae bacterium]|nr:PKD domain-containing protein [Crocinitomicaceae bacterium]